MHQICYLCGFLQLLTQLYPINIIKGQPIIIHIHVNATDSEGKNLDAIYLTCNGKTTGFFPTPGGYVWCKTNTNISWQDAGFPYHNGAAGTYEIENK